MPEVSVVVELRVRVDAGSDPASLERDIQAQGRQAARELYREALHALDDELVAAAGARCRLEARWIFTLVGRIRIRRWRVSTPSGSVIPLDRALGPCSAEPTPALRETICDLSVRLPFRQAAQICSRITGEELSHQSAPGRALKIARLRPARVGCLGQGTRTTTVSSATAASLLFAMKRTLRAPFPAVGISTQDWRAGDASNQRPPVARRGHSY